MGDTSNHEKASQGLLRPPECPPRCHAGQTNALVEGSIFHADDGVADKDVGQAPAIEEGIIPDVGNAVGKRHAGQAAAPGEG